MYSVTTLLYQQLTPHCVCAEYVNGSSRFDTDNGAAARIAQGMFFVNKVKVKSSSG